MQPLLKLIILNIIATTLWTAEINRTGAKLYGLKIDTVTQLQALFNVSRQPGYDFVHFTQVLHKKMMIIVEADKQQEFEDLLERKSIDFKIMLSGLPRAPGKNQTYEVRKPITTKINFSQYYRASDISVYLKLICETYPHLAAVKQIGTSTERRKIEIITISKSRPSEKSIIFIEAGIHAREWTGPLAAMFVIYQLVEKYRKNKKHLEHFDWIVMPVVNPDGYEYSYKSDDFWRKTRSLYKGCYGTDANRNFDFQWGTIGSSDDSCKPNFRGAMPFSEPESRAIRDVLRSYKGRIVLYVAFHAFGRYIFHPWAYSRKTTPNEYMMKKVAATAAEAILKGTGSNYEVGTPPELMYKVGGSSMDYAVAKAEVPLAFTIELGGQGFHPPNHTIKGILNEAWYGVTGMARAIEDFYISGLLESGATSELIRSKQDYQTTKCFILLLLLSDDIY